MVRAAGPAPSSPVPSPHGSSASGTSSGIGMGVRRIHMIPVDRAQVLKQSGNKVRLQENYTDSEEVALQVDRSVDDVFSKLYRSNSDLREFAHKAGTGVLEHVNVTRGVIVITRSDGEARTIKISTLNPRTAEELKESCRKIHACIGQRTSVLAKNPLHVPAFDDRWAPPPPLTSTTVDDTLIVTNPDAIETEGGIATRALRSSSCASDARLFLRRQAMITPFISSIGSIFSSRIQQRQEELEDLERERAQVAATPALTDARREEMLKGIDENIAKAKNAIEKLSKKASAFAQVSRPAMIYALGVDATHAPPEDRHAKARALTDTIYQEMREHEQSKISWMGRQMNYQPRPAEETKAACAFVLGLTARDEDEHVTLEKAANRSLDDAFYSPERAVLEATRTAAMIDMTPEEAAEKFIREAETFADLDESDVQALSDNSKAVFRGMRNAFDGMSRRLSDVTMTKTDGGMQIDNDDTTWSDLLQPVAVGGEEDAPIIFDEEGRAMDRGGARFIPREGDIFAIDEEDV